MAKQKISIIGIVVVVGLLVFMVAVSGGSLKNFSLVTNGLSVEINPTMSVDHAGSQAAVPFTILNYANNDNYFTITPYIDGVAQTPVPFDGGSSSSYYVIFQTTGVHYLYLHFEDNYDSSLQGDSNVCTAYVGVPGPSSTPMPHPTHTPSPTPIWTPNPTGTPTPTNNGGDNGGIGGILQQIINFFNSLFQHIINFFKSLGL
ncbi:MAG: hypothetical protein ABSA79_09175 [Candidatus Bathyarchaeia archaeon]|jgi:hypothetical protein